MGDSGALHERAARFSVTIFLTAGTEMRPFGRTRNLSVTGALVETAERPAVGSCHEIAIVWGDDTFVCNARIVRHTPDAVGIAFVERPDSFTGAVLEILSDAPREPAKRPL